MIIEQDSFVTGLDLISPDTQVSTTGYTWLINGRSRYGYNQPITKPIEITNAPKGKKQGIISVGNSTIVFVAGTAWYKLFNTSQWVKVPNFSMDATVSNIYSIAVPASSRDYVRKLNPSGSVTDKMLLEVNSRNAGMPSGIVCQDGINQPMFITFNEETTVFTARTLGTFDTWTQNNPEYVPIGLFMMFLDQKLFIVAPDQLSVLQSISGQPINFMMNVNTSGDKLASEAIGGAESTSFAFDYDPITCLQAVNVTDSFIYATQTTTRVLTLNFLSTIFGEPLVSQAAIIATGITNQYALIDISGDYAFANGEGLRNFNAVQTLLFQGRNSVFSKMVSKLFTNLKQSYVVCFAFDDYAMFNVNTVCGTLTAVYDTISAQWVALDIQNLAQILQVAIIDLPTETRVYAITADDKIYQLYSVDSEAAQPYLYTRAYSTIGANQYYSGISSYANTGAPITDIKSDKLDLVFRDGTEAGEVTVTEFVDGVSRGTLTKVLVAAPAVTPYVPLPVIQPLIEPEGNRVTFNFNNTPKGFKISYAITWNTDASLMKIRLVTTDINTTTSVSQRSLTLPKA